MNVAVTGVTKHSGYFHPGVYFLKIKHQRFVFEHKKVFSCGCRSYGCIRIPWNFGSVFGTLEGENEK